MTGYVLIGALSAGALISATISGMIGMAGGTLLLLILLLAGLDPAVAVPLHALVQLISNLTRIRVFLPHVRWRPFLTLAASALPFPILGLWMLTHLEAGQVRLLMGLLILYGTWAPKWGLMRLSERYAFVLAGILAGTLGVVIGAVGPLIAPFFLRSNWKKEEIVGTKAACQAFLHLLKIVAFGWLGFSFQEQLPLFVPMAIMVIAGTYLGKALLGKLSEKAFVYAYRGILSLLALRLIWMAFIF